ncbi:MAG TPA: hypothetical protein VE504_01080 [Nitrososphaeraceae archaeon]|nr:hypothetical protein [Nitrososphaeraceae archaeon]
MNIRKINLKMFTILTAIAVSLSVIVYSADVVLGEQSSRKNITIILHPINDPDDDIRNSFSEEFAELLRSNGYEK